MKACGKQPSCCSDQLYLVKYMTEEEGNGNEGNEQAFSSEVVALAVSEGKEIEPETVKDAECQTTKFDYVREIDYLKTSNVIAWK